ncbi:TetR family transcriptional regulator [Temperatibacter marinus]|uniref:TetR family transcriptional regulator n=1 Tax=Temperatibacter marinus TaxID=1456591 RepID=A0AA52EDW8_9PROT|nr:TetR family transcriptional regulator [Temperatibacter marinus]WND02925.1 TetR family transcriptional regulator [Temperatibacter marinus]
MDSARVTSKGEAKKQYILDKALDVIAKEGIKGTTHRLVAKEADVPPSLTTYYFVSIDDLILQAINRFVERVRPEQIQIAHSLINQIHQDQENDLSPREIALGISHRIFTYMVKQLKERPTGLAVEVALLYQSHLNQDLALKAGDYRRALISDAEQVMQALKAKTPALDARLMMGTVLRLEYESLNTDQGPSEQSLKEQLDRLILALIA